MSRSRFAMNTVRTMHLLMHMTLPCTGSKVRLTGGNLLTSLRSLDPVMACNATYYQYKWKYK